MCLTDLGSLIGNTQCGNFRILLPLRIYVKSILVTLKHCKTALLTIWAALNFQFLQTFDIFKCENWFHIESEWQENCYIFTLRNIHNQKFPIRLPRSVYVTARNAIALPYVTLCKWLSFPTFLYNSLIQNQNKNSSIVTAAKGFFL